MKVLRLHAAGDIRLHDEPDPVPGAGEELVRITAVGLCGSDLHWYQDGGIGDAQVERPLVLGHEMGGVIASGPMAGARVALDPAITCERCAYCVAGYGNLCVALRFSGHGSTDGALRELMPWPARLLVRVPDSMEDAEVPMLESLGVALHSIDLAHVRAGMRAGVYGCGPIGLLLIAALRARGVTVPLASDPLAHRRAAALEVGAERALDVDARGIAVGAQDEPVDVAFDVAGADGAVETAIATVRPGGRVVFVGIPGDDRVSFAAAGARRKGLTLAMSRRMQAHHLVQAAGLVASGHIQLGPLVTSRYPMARAREAFEALVRRDGLKVVIEPNT
jgi:L-iditol 2-dehydrogenase